MIWGKVIKRSCVCLAVSWSLKWFYFLLWYVYWRTNCYRTKQIANQQFQFKYFSPLLKFSGGAIREIILRKFDQIWLQSSFLRGDVLIEHRDVFTFPSRTNMLVEQKCKISGFLLSFMTTKRFQRGLEEFLLYFPLKCFCHQIQ